MNQRDYSAQYSDCNIHFSAQSAEPQSFPVTHTAGDEASQNGFGLDPMAFQQQYNTASSFGGYTDQSPSDITQGWTFAQQSYANVPIQPTTDQGYPPLLSQPSSTKSRVSDEGDDTSEPTSPRDEVSERRKEASPQSSKITATKDPLECHSFAWKFRSKRGSLITYQPLPLVVHITNTNTTTMLTLFLISSAAEHKTAQLNEHFEHAKKTPSRSPPHA